MIAAISAGLLVGGIILFVVALILIFLGGLQMGREGAKRAEGRGIGTLLCGLLLIFIGVTMISAFVRDHAFPRLEVGEKGTIVAIYPVAEDTKSLSVNSQSGNISQYFLVRLSDGRDARIPDVDFVGGVVPDEIGVIVIRTNAGVIVWH